MELIVLPAMADSVLRCAGLSEIFTQDMEETHGSSTEQTHTPDPETEKQLSTIMNLLGDPRVNKDEKRKLSTLVNSDLTKDKAGEILDYFYGISEFKNGDWVKVSPGVFDQRGQDDDEANEKPSLI